MASIQSPAEPGSFANRTVIVTGAAGCIGVPLCLSFARAGANVVANDLGYSPTGGGSSSDAFTQLVAKITREGLSAVADTHNVATEADKIVDQAINSFGRVDVIINNARHNSLRRRPAFRSIHRQICL